MYRGKSVLFLNLSKLTTDSLKGTTSLYWDCGDKEHVNPIYFSNGLCRYFLSRMKRHSLLSVNGTQWTGSSLFVSSSTLTVLGLHLPQDSLKTLCHVSSHTWQSGLAKKINTKYLPKVWYSQPRSLSQNKAVGGATYLSWVMGIEMLGTFHWQEELAKSSPSGFRVYLTNSFTTCQMKLVFV